MKRSVEILVIDKLSGEIKYRVRNSFEITNQDPNALYNRFEEYGRGFARLMLDNPDNVIQVSFKDLVEPTQALLFRPSSSRRVKCV